MDDQAKVILGILILVAVFFVVAWIDSIPGNFVSEETAISAMETAGYTDVQVTGRNTWFVDWSGCSDSDAVKFDVVATNQQGQRVTNAFVCAGWPFKGATIRYR